MPEVLFLCTGNYYRSRLAEALFNHAAAQRGLAWRAFSRGLATHLAPPGGLSPVTTAELQRRGIPFSMTSPVPQQVSEADFQRAARVIAVKELEHRPLMADLHPARENQITYWQVHDLDFSPPEEGVAGIEANVNALLAELAGTPAR
jgi:protein-tyrosine phosphatase